LNRNVDILFLIDDSSSMGLMQTSCSRTLRRSPTRCKPWKVECPNVHIGVISSDMGAGDGTVAGCDSTGGKKGILQYTARGTCTATKLNAGARYISNIGGTANYTGTLEDVFSASGRSVKRGAVSSTSSRRSCGPWAPTARRRRRESGIPASGRVPGDRHADERGRLLRDAGVPLFDTLSQTNIQSQVGPPINFRCNEFGHICDGAHPGRVAPNNDVAAMVTYNSCESNDTEGYLLSAVDTANRLKALKAIPRR
jgi:hypothetical protein